jgi:hypothetical protein
MITVKISENKRTNQSATLQSEQIKTIEETASALFQQNKEAFQSFMLGCILKIGSKISLILNSEHPGYIRASTGQEMDTACYHTTISAILID